MVLQAVGTQPISDVSPLPFTSNDEEIFECTLCGAQCCSTCLINHTVVCHCCASSSDSDDSGCSAGTS
eukprot:802137-Karenia_brevis.AAC.1